MILVDIYDNKADSHNYFVVQNKEVLSRELKNIFNSNKETPYTRFPADFDVYLVGTFENVKAGRYDVNGYSQKIYNLSELVTNNENI